MACAVVSTAMDAPDEWVNTKQMYPMDPPLLVEHLVYEVRASVFEHWKATDFQMWTKDQADRFPGFVGKETWVKDLGEWLRASVVIYWRSIDDLDGIDLAWLGAHEARFAEIVGADNVRLVSIGHDDGHHWHKVDEYR